MITLFFVVCLGGACHEERFPQDYPTEQACLVDAQIEIAKWISGQPQDWLKQDAGYCVPSDERDI